MQYTHLDYCKNLYFILRKIKTFQRNIRLLVDKISEQLLKDQRQISLSYKSYDEEDNVFHYFQYLKSRCNFEGIFLLTLDFVTDVG